MNSFQESINVYRQQLKEGDSQKAYKGLMHYIVGLRKHFANTFPDYSVSANIYQGYMDITHFSIQPNTLKDRKLKMTIVFLYDEFRFEGWLSGVNRQVQRQYFDLMQVHQWDNYHIVEQGKGIDAILKTIVADNPDFGNLDALTQQIEMVTVKFIQDIEHFLAKH